MSWHCLQDQEAAFSVDAYLAGLRSARARLSRTPAGCCLPGSETESYPDSRFGMTCGRSTESRGAALLMLSPAGSPAKTSPAPERVQGLQEREAGCGAKCTELLARYARDTHLWKTPQCSLLEGLDEFSETWPKSGMMLRGCAYRQPIAAHRTSGKEFGFSQKMQWLTPTVEDAARKGSANAWEKYITQGFTPGARLRNQVAARVWIGTPTASMTKRSAAFAEGRLPTPQEFVRSFPTPCSNGKGGSHAAKKWEKILQNPNMFPTPTCHDAKLANPAPNKTAQGSPCLTERILEQDTSGGQLNPTWVEWLMGWPIGWTDLELLETDRFQSWLRLHSSPCNESLKG